MMTFLHRLLNFHRSFHTRKIEKRDWDEIFIINFLEFKWKALQTRQVNRSTALSRTWKMSIVTSTRSLRETSWCSIWSNNIFKQRLMLDKLTLRTWDSKSASPLSTRRSMTRILPDSSSKFPGKRLTWKPNRLSLSNSLLSSTSWRRLFETCWQIRFEPIICGDLYVF